MSFYPPKINARFSQPRHAGKLADADANGAGATFICGAVVRFTLQIDKSTKEITGAKFLTNGCGFLIAAADVLAEKVIGKTLAELHGLEHAVLQTAIEADLGEFPALRKHCIELSLDALQAAFANYRKAQIKEFAGDAALICSCFGVSEEVIESLVQAKSLGTVEEVSDVCNAGDGCGSCRPLIQEIIDMYWQENF
jgi:NifU-like protein